MTTWKESVEMFVKGYASSADDEWSRVAIDPTLLDRRSSAISPFYNQAGNICSRRGNPLSSLVLAHAASTTVSAGLVSRNKLTQPLWAFTSYVAECAKVARASTAKDVASFIAELNGVAKIADTTECDEFLAHLANRASVSDVRDEISRRLTKCRDLVQVATSALDTLREVTPRRSDPSESGWEEIASRFDSKQSYCSLIYIYWLEEAGLFWALERLAERVENGHVESSRALANVRVPEGSNAKDVLSNFVSMWQRGELSAIDERRAQYAAVYGFQVHAAGAWGALETIDPRTRFAEPFHRFLYECASFYKQRRNLQVEPNTQPSRIAFSALVDVLREGNENLRTRKPLEYRAQVEYTKQALGGRRPVAAVPATPFQTALIQEWRSSLPGRPGVSEAVDPWQFATDTIAGLYGWSRAGVRDYLALAECGELLLVMTRAVGASNVSDDAWFAFLLAIQEPVVRYIGSFRNVTGVDLEQRLISQTPAELLARRGTPPPVPPMRRGWTSEPAAYGLRARN